MNEKRKNVIEPQVPAFDSAREDENVTVEADPETGIGVPWDSSCTKCDEVKGQPPGGSAWQINVGLHFYTKHGTNLIQSKPRHRIPPLGP